MSPAAEFIGVTQRFGDFTAVDAIDLEIPEGKLTTLLGPSGCGKTTSLRMLAGYSRPTSGTIRIHGVDSTTLPPEKRGLGMVFQSYALFPHLTVAENVGYGLKLRKLPRAAVQQKVEETLELVGLAHLHKSKPKKLSGGQQQRVALARAIAIRPRLLLLDEPLSNLDARLRVQMRTELRRIQAETGLTVVLVTHDQDEALEMSDLMVLMRGGKIMQTGTPREVFSRPANRFVADFLGYENFLTDQTHTFSTVRPEHLILGAASDGSAALRLDATVVSTAYRGVDLLVTLDAVDGAGETVRLLADVRAGDGAGLTPGTRTTVSAAAAHLVPIAA
ncbi:ABC transporter ATP-binding protein [Catenuloplanes japonicus]|uniref:ABC transporter ATP-binding protein n=1 Tax=Catenuloplanes japonicus TaxID=33876 RepID=UPI00052704BB|nr:ABC transporter ATP-binding protein [Catenuloplanes japonicus]